jgi:hypothetical protein
VIGGAREIKNAIENDASVLAACQTLRVTGATITEIAVGGITYIAVRFDAEVYT